MACSAASAVALDSNAAPGEPFVADFRAPATNRSVEALAWRDGSKIYVTGDTLRALGIQTASGPDLFVLGETQGVTYHVDVAAAAVIVDCTSACFNTQTVNPRNTRPALSDAKSAGGFLNVDLVASQTEDTRSTAGAFELGIFGPRGFGEATWTMGAQGDADIVRLDTRWTIDQPDRRIRFSIGDSVTRPGATGLPMRFGGLQIGTDYSLDPTFVPFPLPAIDGEANSPSVVDLYINGALRLHDRVNAGPFTIVDAPVVAGAGVAQVVVTDALGQEHMISQPFYASPALLRRGLSFFSASLGAEREVYGRQSASYGRGFAAGLYRRGLSDGVTVETRLEAAPQHVLAGSGFTAATGKIGQFDLALAGSMHRDRSGALAQIGWSHLGPVIAFTGALEAISEDFHRLGAAPNRAPPEARARATFAVNLGEGSASATGAWSDERDRRSIGTLALNYFRPVGRAGGIGLTALYVDDDEDTLTLAFTLTTTLGADITSSSSLRVSDRRWTADTRLRSSPRSDGGFDWRAGMSRGAVDRLDGAIGYDSDIGFARLEASRVGERDGLRVRAGAAVAWLDDAMFVSRPIRDSFAVVDAGAPDISVYRDHRRIGQTGSDGRLLVTGLRAYEANQLGIELDDLPITAEVEADEIAVAPAARSGVVAEFRVTKGVAGEFRIVDEFGVPIPAGTYLERQGGGGPIPVGRAGRVFLSAVEARATLLRLGQAPCMVQIEPEQVASNATLVCRTAAR